MALGECREQGSFGNREDLRGNFRERPALTALASSSAADSEGAMIMLVSAIGVAIAIALYWWVRGRRGYPLSWP
jgi:hypothetical protein